MSDEKHKNHRSDRHGSPEEQRQQHILQALNDLIELARRMDAKLDAILKKIGE